WVEPDGISDAAPLATAARRVTLDKQGDIADWFYRPLWQRAETANQGSTRSKPQACWLLFADDRGLANRLAERLRGADGEIVFAIPGEMFSVSGSDRIVLRPAHPPDYSALLSELARRGRALAGIVHLWGAGTVASDSEESFQRAQERGFYSLLFLAQAIGRQGLREPLRIDVVTSGVHCVSGRETLVPERATVLGPCKVIPQEMARLFCRNIDLDLPADGGWDGVVSLLAAEIASPAAVESEIV